jgi:hypothetical protein
MVLAEKPAQTFDFFFAELRFRVSQMGSQRVLDRTAKKKNVNFLTYLRARRTSRYLPTVAILATLVSHRRVLLS